MTNLFEQLNFKACEDLYETYVDKIDRELQQCNPNEVVGAMRGSSPSCTYCYYRGRLALYSEKYDDALSLMSRAYENCDARAYRNRA